MPVRLEGRRELLHRVAGGLLEGGPQREVLDRVAGEDELGEDDEAGAALRGIGHARADELRVPGEVPDRGVDLGEGDADRHGPTLLPAGSARIVTDRLTHS